MVCCGESGAIDLIRDCFGNGEVQYAIIVIKIASQRRRLCGTDCFGNGEVQYAIVVIEIASQRRSRKSGATVLNRGTDHITRNEAELLCAELTKRSDIMKKEIASAMEKVHYAIIVMHIASQRRRLCGADCFGNGGMQYAIVVIKIASQ